MSTIESLHAIEILDSRGRPTVKVKCRLTDGAVASASVPSGASRGRAEAREVRDGDPSRYHGNGCRTAVANVNEILHRAAAGRKFHSQRKFDEFLIVQDGTAEKSHLGANAILGCSLAFARASAVSQAIPLYQYFNELIRVTLLRMPRLTINLFSGGLHAGGQVSIQDVLLVPMAASIDESLAMTSRVVRAAAELCSDRFQMRLLTADEGGLSPPCGSSAEMIELAAEAVGHTRYGEQMRLAVDVAASHFERQSRYQLDGDSLSADEMVARVLQWVGDYSLLSVEDALGQDDWTNWQRMTSQVPEGTCIVGDDLLCTNPERIRKAIVEQAANTLLLKVNQIGTLTEASDAYKLAKKAGWKVVVSARSGETEDDWLADLAVGWAADFIKVGSITQSERLAKYNRLLEIEEETGWSIPTQ